MRKLGDAIRDGDATAYGELHYDELWSWCNNLVAAAYLDLVSMELEQYLELESKVAITGRAKVRATVREKLLRRRSEKLPSIQDLAGLRVEADMTLAEQDAIVAAICSRFGLLPQAIHDLRDGSHSGYRGVHVWVRLSQPKGAWFEIQVRTRAQGAWANAYEALADVLGRGIRYGEVPASPIARELVDYLQRVSLERIAAAETLMTESPAQAAQSRTMVAEITEGLTVFAKQVRSVRESR